MYRIKYLLCLLFFSSAVHLAKAQTNKGPCMENEAARRFDFWIGEWEVTANGKKAGENVITLAPGGCAIHESYTTGRGYSGQSINYWDPFDGKWKQNWVGSAGDVMVFVETEDYEEANLQFMAKIKTAKGAIVWRRMSFTYNASDDTVRQLIEDSADEGRTWKVNFDGLYKKKQS